MSRFACILSILGWIIVVGGVADNSLSDKALATECSLVDGDCRIADCRGDDAVLRGCGCQACECCGCCSLGEPWKLPQPCCLQQHGIAVGGWLEQGITFNAQRPADRFNGPIGTNDWDRQYQLNQFWVYLTKPVDTGGCGWDIGGHVDLVYGTDWRFGINNGLENRINGIGQSYGLVIPQMYVEVGVNNLSVKIGHFAGILDYEVVPAPMNPFYSHSYSYAYTVPQLVTGVMGDYKLSDQWSVQAGFNRGWMMFEDINHHLDFMGGVKWSSQDQKSSLAYGVDVGPQDPAGNQNRFVYSLVWQQQMSEKLRYVLVHNLGYENDGTPSGDDAEWYGLNQYFLYTINPCWSANLRFEWLRDDDGAKIVGLGAAVPGTRAWTGSGFAGNFYELTAGVTWRPNANVMVRPEIRWDWYDGLRNGSGQLPFDALSASHQFTFATDVIFTF